MMLPQRSSTNERAPFIRYRLSYIFRTLGRSARRYKYLVVVALFALLLVILMVFEVVKKDEIVASTNSLVDRVGGVINGGGGFYGAGLGIYNPIGPISPPNPSDQAQLGDGQSNDLEPIPLPLSNSPVLSPSHPPKSPKSVQSNPDHPHQTPIHLSPFQQMSQIDLPAHLQIDPRDDPRDVSNRSLVANVLHKKQHPIDLRAEMGPIGDLVVEMGTFGSEMPSYPTHFETRKSQYHDLLDLDYYPPMFDYPDSPDWRDVFDVSQIAEIDGFDVDETIKKATAEEGDDEWNSNKDLSRVLFSIKASIDRNPAITSPHEDYKTGLAIYDVPQKPHVFPGADDDHRHGLLGYGFGGVTIATEWVPDVLSSPTNPSSPSWTPRIDKIPIHLLDEEEFERKEGDMVPHPFPKAEIKSTYKPYRGSVPHPLYQPVDYNRADHDLKSMSRSYEYFCFNRYCSWGLPLDRPIEDHRQGQCADQSLLDGYEAVLDRPQDGYRARADVVMVFHNEDLSVLLRSIHSVLNTSDPRFLGRIILVNDDSNRASHPWLFEDLPIHVAYLPKVELIHMTRRRGLMMARIEGARFSSEENVVFLDSHIETTRGWLEPLLDVIEKNPKHVVTPVISSIEHEDFELRYGGIEALSFTWSLGQHHSSERNMWNRYDDTARRGFMSKTQWDEMNKLPQQQQETSRLSQTEPRVSPIMAGGLFAANKHFLLDVLGGYDEEMRLYGGEEMEIGFKIWMCGGGLYNVPCSSVAHIFRVPDYWEGQVYTVPYEEIMRNKKRAAAVWMDQYNKLFDSVSGPLAPTHPLGNMFKQKQKRETCLNRGPSHSFDWFLDNIAIGVWTPDIDTAKTGYITTLNELKAIIKDTQDPHTLSLSTHKLTQIKCVDEMGRGLGEELGFYWCHMKGGRQSFMSIDGNMRLVTDALERCWTVNGPGGAIVQRTCPSVKSGRWSSHKGDGSNIHSVSVTDLIAALEGHRGRLGVSDSLMNKNQNLRHLDAESNDFDDSFPRDVPASDDPRSELLQKLYRLPTTVALAGRDISIPLSFGIANVGRTFDSNSIEAILSGKALCVEESTNERLLADVCLWDESQLLLFMETHEVKI